MALSSRATEARRRGFRRRRQCRLKNGAPRVALQTQADNSVCGQTARRQTEDVMAWRDDKARATLIREAAGSMQPGKTPRTFAELLFDHTIIAGERDDHGKLLRFYGETLTEGAKGERESLIHFHIARLDADADRQKLIEGLAKTLNDVCACVTDWRAMRARVEQAIKTYRSNPPPLPIDEVAEANQFLQWLCADNFTFLGLREYRFSSDIDASDA